MMNQTTDGSLSSQAPLQGIPPFGNTPIEVSPGKVTGAWLDTKYAEAAAVGNHLGAHYPSETVSPQGPGYVPAVCSVGGLVQ
jgi:hypothetical protein